MDVSSRNLFYNEGRLSELDIQSLLITYLSSVNVCKTTTISDLKTLFGDEESPQEKFCLRKIISREEKNLRCDARYISIDTDSSNPENYSDLFSTFFEPILKNQNYSEDKIKNFLLMFEELYRNCVGRGYKARDISREVSIDAVLSPSYIVFRFRNPSNKELRSTKDFLVHDSRDLGKKIRKRDKTGLGLSLVINYHKKYGGEVILDTFEQKKGRFVSVTTIFYNREEQNNVVSRHPHGSIN